jgi:glutamate synthase (NADPH/NADH) small chain
VPIPGQQLILDTDMVIVAIGSGANPLLTQHSRGLALNRRGYIVANERGATPQGPIWAGGDIVTGSATVILAMGAGRTAAQDIHAYLLGQAAQPAAAPSAAAPA